MKNDFEGFVKIEKNPYLADQVFELLKVTLPAAIKGQLHRVDVPPSEIATWAFSTAKKAAELHHAFCGEKHLMVGENKLNLKMCCNEPMQAAYIGTKDLIEYRCNVCGCSGVVKKEDKPTPPCGSTNTPNVKKEKLGQQYNMFSSLKCLEQEIEIMSNQLNDGVEISQRELLVAICLIRNFLNAVAYDANKGDQ